MTHKPALRKSPEALRRLLRYLWQEADIEEDAVSGGKVRDLFAPTDPLAVDVGAALYGGELFDPAAEHCHKCGQAVGVVWTAPDDLWSGVTGRFDGSGILCVQCFDDRATAQGRFIRWVPQQEQPHDAPGPPDILDELGAQDAAAFGRRVRAKQ